MFYLKIKGLIILIFYCILLFAFHPRKLGKVAPINFDMIFLYKNMVMHGFNRRCHIVPVPVTVHIMPIILEDFETHHHIFALFLQTRIFAIEKLLAGFKCNPELV